MISTRNALVGTMVTAMAFALAFVVPQMLADGSNTAETQDAVRILNEFSKIADEDCMDLWSYKMETFNRNKAKMARINSQRAESTESYTLDLLDTEYNCEIEPRLGARFGEGGSYICGASLLVERAECVSYAILADASHPMTMVEAELAKDAHCKARVLEPSSPAVESFKAREVKLVAATAADKNAPIDVVHTAPELKDADLLEIMNNFGDKQHRIDVLRIDCPECDTKFYDGLFGLIADNKIAVGQVTLRLSNNNPKLIELVDEWRGTLGYMVNRKDVKSSCDGKCADVSLIHQSEARSMYQRLHCGDASLNLGNHVF